MHDHAHGRDRARDPCLYMDFNRCCNRANENDHRVDEYEGEYECECANGLLSHHDRDCDHPLNHREYDLGHVDVNGSASESVNASWHSSHNFHRLYARLPSELG